MIPYSLHSFGRERVIKEFRVSPELNAVIQVFLGGRLTGGGELEEAFEGRFAEYVGAKYAVAVNSCAAALYLAIKATFPGEGVRIAVPALTYVATANAVVLAGHIPVICDIDPETFCIDPAKIPEDVDGVIPVHYAGHSCNLDKIREGGEWAIIEDAAHACGAEYKGKKIGSINTTCFSFHPCKNMTTAEGGMITTNSHLMADHLRRMRLNGIQKDGLYQDMVEFGFKFNMNEIQVAIGIEQLKRLDEMNKRRQEIASHYLMNLCCSEQIVPQVGHGYESLSVHHLFPILVQDRDNLAHYLQSKGIGCAIHYKPVHLMSWYRAKFGYKEGDFPVAEEVSKHILSIPIYPDMTDEEVKFVIQSIKEGVNAD